MNKRQKKKAKAYKGLTYKQRIKNQAKTIRQLHTELERYKGAVNEADKAMKMARETIDALMEINSKLNVTIDELTHIPKKSWWKKWGRTI